MTYYVSIKKQSKLSFISRMKKGGYSIVRSSWIEFSGGLNVAVFSGPGLPQLLNSMPQVLDWFAV